MYVSVCLGLPSQRVDLGAENFYTEGMKEFIVSACLAGLPCKYNGGSNTCPAVVALVRQGRAVTACPESLGGLKAPRPPAEQQQGKVLDKTGKDVSEAFHKGAQAAMEVARHFGCTKAIVKTKSPSCGAGHIYDGTFSHTLTPGDGLWVQALKAEGIAIYTEKDLPPECAEPHFLAKKS